MFEVWTQRGGDSRWWGGSNPRVDRLCGKAENMEPEDSLSRIRWYKETKSALERAHAETTGGF